MVSGVFVFSSIRRHTRYWRDWSSDVCSSDLCLEWEVPALETLEVPVVQGICATSSRGAWLESDAGLSPLDTAWQVAIPEFDGRIVSVPFSFKERIEGDSPVGAPLTLYRADRSEERRVGKECRSRWSP